MTSRLPVSERAHNEGCICMACEDKDRSVHAMTARLPVSEGAMTALRALAAWLIEPNPHIEPAEVYAAYERSERALSALLDRMEVIDPARVTDLFWSTEAHEPAELSLVAYVCGQTEATEC